jgi:hypothetical protein
MQLENAYKINFNWRPDQLCPGSGRTFNNIEEQELTIHIRTHYLAKHLPLTMQSMGAIILALYNRSHAEAPTTGDTIDHQKSERSSVTGILSEIL